MWNAHRGVFAKGSVVNFFILEEVIDGGSPPGVVEVVFPVVEEPIKGLEPSPRGKIALVAKSQMPPFK